MKISEKLFVLLSLMVGLATVIAPVNALGDIVAFIGEGEQAGLNGFTVTNNNTFAVTLTGLSASVLKAGFGGPDPFPSDYVTSVVLAGGTCIPLGKVLAPGASCTVNLTVSTPPPDQGEPSDFGVSQLGLSVIFDNGPVTTRTFEVQVNDPPAVPEPESVMLVGLGIAVLLGAGCVAKRRGLNQGYLST